LFLGRGSDFAPEAGLVVELIILFQNGFSSVTNRAKFEEYFSVPAWSQRMLERFLELLERIHMLDCG
jgi:hypothetical protein